VSTITVASTRALLILLNAGVSSLGLGALAPGGGRMLMAIPLLCTVVGLGTALSLLLHAVSRSQFIAGH